MKKERGKAVNCPHKDRDSYAYGLCKGCYHVIRYNFDKGYKEKIKEKARRFYKKKLKENPNWNSERQRNYREKNPRKFNFIMARAYFRKLNNKEREKLLKEVGGIK